MDQPSWKIGDRTAGDEGSYPQDDPKAVIGADGKWKFMHKGGQRLLI